MRLFCCHMYRPPAGSRSDSDNSRSLVTVVSRMSLLYLSYFLHRNSFMVIPGLSTFCAGNYYWEEPKAHYFHRAGSLGLENGRIFTNWWEEGYFSGL